MNPVKLLIGLIPWFAFSLIVNRVGDHAAGIAAAIAGAIALVFLIRDGREIGINFVDAAGVVVFFGLAVYGFAGGDSAERWVADYGRGLSTFALAAIMWISVVTIPFTEQYARESVPREYWKTPTFRAVNRKISLLWSVLVTVMAFGHTIAGVVDPASKASSGSRPVDLLFNWVIPAVIVVFGIKATKHLAENAGERAPARENAATS